LKSISFSVRVRTPTDTIMPKSTMEIPPPITR
jgi:hypothetical protein